MRKLSEFKIHWIEEPTCADDVLGHKRISEVSINDDSDASSDVSELVHVCQCWL